MPGRWIRWLIAAQVVVFLAALPVTSASAASLAVPSGGTVHVVNALAGVTARVLMDGQVVHESATPKSVVGPLTLPAGKHVLELWSGGLPVAAAQYTLAAGDALDVVAHRAADRTAAPLITVFRNDLSAVGPGKARLVVSHVAVAEPADILIDGRPYFRNVANAESLSVVVPEGSYALSMTATAGRRREVLAPVPVSVTAGTFARVFAFGDPDDRTSGVIVQVLPIPVTGSKAPVLVRTGDGGQAASAAAISSDGAWTLATAAVVGFGLAGAAGTRLGAVRSARAAGARRSP